MKAVGKENWVRLQPLYEQLLEHSSPSIQLTLAASLGEIASLTQGSSSSDFLMKYFTIFLHHSDSDIVTACIHSSSSLFKSITIPYQIILCQVLS